MTTFATAKPFLDLRRYHFVRTIGQLTIYGVWIPRADDEDQSEPAMAIMRAHGPTAKPVVIGLSAMYKYTDAKYMAHASHHIAVSLGFEPNVSTAISIAHLINDHMSDVISMPPEPTQTIVVGTMEMPDSTGKKISADILDHTPARL